MTGQLRSRTSGTSAPYNNQQNLEYVYHQNENLTDRIDHNQGGLTEHFEYDALNRLSYSTLTGVSGHTLDVGIDAAGSITSKSRSVVALPKTTMPFRLTVAAAALALLQVGDRPDLGSCIDTPVAELFDPSGIHFFVKDTACDSFGNDMSESVLAARGAGGRKTLLFKFGPDERSPPPRITVKGGKTIVIQVDSVLDIIYQATTYDSYAIEYAVSHVEYN